MPVVVLEEQDRVAAGSMHFLYGRTAGSEGSSEQVRSLEHKGLQKY